MSASTETSVSRAADVSDVLRMSSGQSPDALRQGSRWGHFGVWSVGWQGGVECAQACRDAAGGLGDGAAELLQHGEWNAEPRRGEHNRRARNTAMVVDRGGDADLFDGGAAVVDGIPAVTHLVEFIEVRIDGLGVLGSDNQPPVEQPPDLGRGHL